MKAVLACDNQSREFLSLEKLSYVCVGRKGRGFIRETNCQAVNGNASLSIQERLCPTLYGIITLLGGSS